MLNNIMCHLLFLILVLMLIVPSGYAFSKLEDAGSFAYVFVGLLSVVNIISGIVLVIAYIFGGS